MFYFMTEKEKIHRIAISLFKKAKKMEKKVGLNGQLKLKLGEEFKDFIETFEE